MRHSCTTSVCALLGVVGEWVCDRLRLCDVC